MDFEVPFRGPPWDMIGTLSGPGASSWRTAPSEPLFSLAARSVPAVFQWLKQIEGTEAALTQKMLDLEKEKVKDATP